MSAPPTDVVDRLERLAAHAPAGGVDPDAVWSQGRRRQRVRTGVVGAALVVVAVLSAVTTPLLARSGRSRWSRQPPRTGWCFPTWSGSRARGSRRSRPSRRGSRRWGRGSATGCGRAATPGGACRRRRGSPASSTCPAPRWTWEASPPCPQTGAGWRTGSPVRSAARRSRCVAAGSDAAPVVGVAVLDLATGEREVVGDPVRARAVRRWCGLGRRRALVVRRSGRGRTSPVASSARVELAHVGPDDGRAIRSRRRATAGWRQVRGDAPGGFVEQRGDASPDQGRRRGTTDHAAASRCPTGHPAPPASWSRR